jgi:hypothetical protein
MKLVAMISHHNYEYYSLLLLLLLFIPILVVSFGFTFGTFSILCYMLTTISLGSHMKTI